MEKGKGSDDSLRKKAEKRLRPRLGLPKEIPLEDSRELIHELRVHQIELEMQNDELRHSQVQLDESRARYADLYDFAPVGYVTFDRAGLIVEANLTAAQQLGHERARILMRPFLLYVLEIDRDAFHLHLAKVFRTRERQTCELRLKPRIGEGFYARLDSIFTEDAGEQGLVRTSISDISCAKRAEEAMQRSHDELEERVRDRTSALSAANEQLMQEMEARRQREIETQASNALLRLLNEVIPRKEYLDAAVAEIQRQTECNCVGIRVLNENHLIPYQSLVGFSREFWEAENWLSITRDCCVCTRIISEQVDTADAPYMTEAGAFLCNDTFELAAGLSEEGMSRFRGSCIKQGFRSVAVIPVRHGGKVVGAIHLADKRAGMVPQKQVAFVESLAELIGAALYKFNIQDRLQQNYDTQNVVNALLRYSLEDVSLDTLLGRGLDLLLSIPWLFFESKGSIFLVEGEADALVMKVQRGLTAERQACCNRVPFGQCVCGRAVLERQIQLIPCPDGHHKLCSGSSPHSHYCLPIHFAGSTLGLINLYVGIDHHQEPREMEFLTAISNTLAGIIHRKGIEEALRQGEEKYRELVENANSAILRFDTEGKIAFCNEFTQRFFGYAEEELIGRNVLETILPETDSYGRDLSSMVENIVTHPERYVNIEHENKRRNGERVWLAWTNKAVFEEDGRLAGVLAIGTDITARKRAEDELEAYAARLELLNREIHEFAFVASHDLQEPLRKIQTFGSRIEKEYGDRLEDRGRDYLLRMKKSAHRMSGLIKALLDYSRVAVKLGSLEKVDLARVARESASDLQNQSEQQVLLLEIVDLPTVDADPDQMKELFRHLLSNALKFRRKEAPPAVKIYSRSERDFHTIFVEDNGIGFDKQFLGKVFTPLQRLHAKSDYGGIGMGLAICRKILERHGGAITAESVPGRGSTFMISLPAGRHSTGVRAD
jgi:PAS domain S-box-containing protein